MLKTVAILCFSSAIVSAANYGATKKPEEYVPEPEYEYKPSPTINHPPAYIPDPYEVEEDATPPPNFTAPTESYPSPPVKEVCNEKCQPNSAKYMSYVCGSLYTTALKWASNNCKAYYAVANPKDYNSLYQAKLCTYWTERSVLKVVSSCYIEAHLRNEFITKYGKEGPGVWYCKYKEFVEQVMECYGGSLKYYPLGESMNPIEKQVASFVKTNKDDMPPFVFTGSSVAMCAYYNKDQVYHGSLTN